MSSQINENNKNQIQESSTISKEKIIFNNIKESLSFFEEDNQQISNIETTSKVSTDSSSSTKENKLNEFYNSFEFFQFEQNFKRYYLDSSQNNNGNYDIYVKNSLKLISLIPFRKLFINEKIQEISKSINFQKLIGSDKKLLILDLDETLIHVDFDYILKDKIDNYDKILYFDSEDEENIDIPLIIRPGLYEFLEYVSKEFELIVFTASEKEYADAIINYIEKDKKYFKMRLYRNHCIYIEPGLYIKDLRIFSGYKKMEDIIIVDNSLFSFANQLNNGILITSFFEDKNDTFLNNVKDYLEYIKDEKDIREINKESFKFEEIKEDINRNNNNN